MLDPLLLLQLHAAVVKSVGAYYDAKTQQYQLQSAAITADYEASVAGINARQFEQQASDTFRAGQQAIGQRTLQGGFARSSQQAAQGARGIVGGVGSAGEVIASGDIVTEIDVMTLNSNSVRAANQSRMQAVDQRNRADFARLSARNLRGSARTIKPLGRAVTSLMGSVANTAQSYR